MGQSPSKDHWAVIVKLTITHTFHPAVLCVGTYSIHGAQVTYAKGYQHRLVTTAKLRLTAGRKEPEQLHDKAGEPLLKQVLQAGLYLLSEK